MRSFTATALGNVNVTAVVEAGSSRPITEKSPDCTGGGLAVCS